jgi:hypothetical protein
VEGVASDRHRGRTRPSRVTSAATYLVEEEDVSDVDRGKDFLGRYPLHQLPDLHCELDGEVLEHVGASALGPAREARPDVLDALVDETAAAAAAHEVEI